MPYIEKSGFTNCKTLVKSIVSDLTENGFTKMSYGDSYSGQDPDYYVLTASNKVNSLAGTQDWCIWFDARGGDSENDELECAVLTPQQIVVTKPQTPSESPNVLEPAKLTATDTALSVFGDYNIRNTDPAATLNPTGNQPKFVYYAAANIPQKTNYSLANEYVGILGSHIFTSKDIVDTNNENNLSFYDYNTAGAMAYKVTFNDPSFYKFFDRSEHPNSIAYPMSYSLVISNRGIALNIWEQASDDAQDTQNSSRGSRFSWVVVQRPVHKDTGSVYVDGNAPVFCLYSCGRKQYDVQPLHLPNTPISYSSIQNLNTGQEDINLKYLKPYSKLNLVTWSSPIRRFTVREKNVDKPTISVPATIATVDNNAVLNDSQQVAIAEDGRYILTFPNKWNTQTSLYPVDTDLIATTSADVLSQGAEVSFKPYGEGTDRTYKAMQANGVNNTGMRILFMKEGPGISLTE